MLRYHREEYEYVEREDGLLGKTSGEIDRELWGFVLPFRINMV